MSGICKLSDIEFSYNFRMLTMPEIPDYMNIFQLEIDRFVPDGARSRLVTAADLLSAMPHGVRETAEFIVEKPGEAPYRILARPNTSIALPDEFSDVKLTQPEQVLTSTALSHCHYVRLPIDAINLGMLIVRESVAQPSGVFGPGIVKYLEQKLAANPETRLNIEERLGKHSAVSAFAVSIQEQKIFYLL
jgi:hypothetical protein